MATRIDTLRTYESIHDAGVEAAAARAITAAIETALSVSQEQLATKSDLFLLATKDDLLSLRTDFQIFRNETASEFGKVRTELQGGLGSLRSDLEKAIADAQLKTVLWLGGVMLALSGILLTGFRLL